MAQFTGAAPRYFGSSEALQVDAAVARQVDDVLGNDFAVADDDDGVGGKRLQLLVNFRRADLFRLVDGQAKFDGRALDRRRRDFPAAPRGLIRLRVDAANSVPGGGQCPQRRHRKLRRPHKN